MKKKKAMAFNVIITIVVLIVVLIVLLVAFFGGDGLLNKAADAANWISNKFMPKSGSNTQIPAGTTESTTATEIFENVVGVFENGKSVSPYCLISIPKINDNALKGYTIKVLKTGDGTQIKLMTGDTEVDSASIENVYPCAIASTDATVPKNFHENWVTTPVCDPNGAGKKCKTPDFKEFSTITIEADNEKNRLTIEPFKTVSYHNINDKLLFYKADKTHLCFVTTFDDLAGGCDIPTVHEGHNEGINNDCLARLVSNMPFCESYKEPARCGDYLPDVCFISSSMQGLKCKLELSGIPSQEICSPCGIKEKCESYFQKNCENNACGLTCRWENNKCVSVS